MKRLIILPIILLGILSCAPSHETHEAVFEEYTGAFVNIYDTVDGVNGSGFIAEYNGELFVITAAHVYEEIERPIFITMMHRTAYYRAEHATPPPIIDTKADIAIIPWKSHFDRPKKALRLRKSAIQKGEKVYVTCNPFLFENIPRDSVYVKMRTSPTFPSRGKLLKVEARTKESTLGCSGSAVLDSKSRVVGMHILEEKNDPSKTSAVPAWKIIKQIEQRPEANQ